VSNVNKTSTHTNANDQIVPLSLRALHLTSAGKARVRFPATEISFYLFMLHIVNILMLLRINDSYTIIDSVMPGAVLGSSGLRDLDSASRRLPGHGEVH